MSSDGRIRLSFRRTFYAVFTGAVLLLLALDLGVFHREAHAVGLALVLVFVGLKMVWLNDWYGGKFPITVSLAIICAVLALSVVASLLIPKRPVARRGVRGPGVAPIVEASRGDGVRR